MGDGDQPGFDVGAGRQPRVGLEGGQEGVRPGIVRVDDSYHGPADPQDGRTVLGDHLLERLLARHDVPTRDGRELGGVVAELGVDASRVVNIVVCSR